MPDHSLEVNELSSKFLRLLPQEIISEIFMFCLPPLNKNKNEPTKNHPLPLRLGAICSAWRRIAWSIPMLWATVQVRLTDVHEIQDQIFLLKEWLSRTGDLPLTICLSVLEWLREGPDEAMMIISKYTLRWRYIDIRLPSACYTFLALGEDASFPVLKSLILRPNYGTNPEKDLDFLNTPHLTHLTLAYVFLGSVNFRWENITYLNLHGFPIDKITAVLMQTPRLFELAVSEVYSPGPDHSYYDFEYEPIHLPYLTNLSISSDPNGEMGRVLCVPALLRLSLSDMDLTISEPIMFLTRFKCALEDLCLFDSWMDDSDLLRLLAVVPSLKHLSITMPRPGGEDLTWTKLTPITDTMLQKCDATLASAIQAPCIVPCLELLIYNGLMSFSWVNLMKMIHSRTTHLSSDVTSGQLREVDLILRLSSEAQVTDIQSEGEIHQERGVKLSLTIEIAPMASDIVIELISNLLKPGNMSAVAYE